MVGGQKTIFHWVPDHYQNMVVLDQFLFLLCGVDQCWLAIGFFKDSFRYHTGYQYQYFKKSLGVKSVIK
jgi:hypothetical protein